LAPGKLPFQLAVHPVLFLAERRAERMLVKLPRQDYSRDQFIKKLHFGQKLFFCTATTDLLLSKYQGQNIGFMGF
jgi:hypothetical protein